MKSLSKILTKINKMESLFEIALRNKNKLPIEVNHVRWGKLTITLDLVENIKKSNQGYYSGEAYTLSENYKAVNGSKGKYKLIGSSHLDKWVITSEHQEALKEYYKEQKRLRQLNYSINIPKIFKD